MLYGDRDGNRIADAVIQSERVPVDLAPSIPPQFGALTRAVPATPLCHMVKVVGSLSGGFYAGNWATYDPNAAAWTLHDDVHVFPSNGETLAVNTFCLCQFVGVLTSDGLAVYATPANTTSAAQVTSLQAYANYSIPSLANIALNTWTNRPLNLASAVGSWGGAGPLTSLTLPTILTAYGTNVSYWRATTQIEWADSASLKRNGSRHVRIKVGGTVTAQDGRGWGSDTGFQGTTQTLTCEFSAVHGTGVAVEVAHTETDIGGTGIGCQSLDVVEYLSVVPLY